jgi:hypothetical protein
MNVVAPTVQRHGPSVQAPKTAQDVRRFVLLRMPRAMIPIDMIAIRLGISRPDTIELVRGLEADGVLTTWGDYCMLSESEADRQALTLASTPFKGDADPSAWYWVRSAGIRYVDSPWLIPLSLLPGSRRNCIWWRTEQRRHQDTSWPCDRFDELDPHGDRLPDPRPANEPLEDDRLTERLSETALWARDQSEGRLPPRIEDRRRMLPKADRAEYRQAMRLRIGIGTTAPGWTPAHEMIRIETDSANNLIHTALDGSCPVCRSRDLEHRKACLGCCRSGLDRWLDTMPAPDVA